MGWISAFVSLKNSYILKVIHIKIFLKVGIMEKLSEKEKMLRGLQYEPRDEELDSARKVAKECCFHFNNLNPNETEERLKQINTLFDKKCDAWIEPPFYCDYGFNITVGREFYANHGLTILDTASVTFGDDVLIGPGVLISCATHPLDAEERRSGKELALPIVVGDNVWIGMGAKILPGVTIGDNAVIAAGAVVNRDVASNSVVAGVPAKFIRDVS